MSSTKDTKEKKTRNGLDTLNIVLAVLAAGFIGLGFGIKSYVSLAVALVLVIWFLFRALSTDLEKRARENGIFARCKAAIKESNDLRKQKKKDKDHVYKKCPKCRKVLRVKRVKGEKSITCPYCATPITFTIRRDAPQKKAEKAQ